MPVVTKSNINGNGYSPILYCSFLSESTVLSRAINMASISYPLTAITYDDPYSGSGSYTDVEEGMEVIVYDGNTTTIKGRLRVAAGGATSTVLQVSEFSRGEIDLEDNDKFVVVKSFRVRTKLVEASEQFRKDSRIDVGDYTDDMRPTANGGGVYVNWVSKTSSVVLSGNYSMLVDPGAVGALSFAWAFPSPASPTSAATAVTVQDFSAMSAGTHWGSLTVTSPNGTTNKKHVPIRLHDANDPPINVSEARISGSDEDGWNASITLHESANIDDVPDGSMVILWEDYANENNTRQQYGNRHDSRSHIKFVGYFVRESLRKTPDEESISFEALSPMQIMAQLTGFSQVLTRVASTPTTWLEWSDLSVLIALDSLYRWGTSIMSIHDTAYLCDNFDYPELFLNPDTPLNQLRDLARAIDAVQSCDRTGNLWVTRPIVMESDSADRAAASTVITLDEDDILEIEIPREHRDTTNLVDASGFVAGYGTYNQDSGRFETTPVFSRAPGLAPGDAPGRTLHERLICVDQDDCNIRAGLKLARENSKRNGQRVAKNIRVTLPGSYDIFDPAYNNEWVVLDLDENLRGIAYSNVRCIVRRVEINYSVSDSGDMQVIDKSVTLTLDEETDGPPGATYVPPDVEPPEIDEFPPIQEPPIVPDDNPVDGFGTLAVFFGT